MPDYKTITQEQKNKKEAYFNTYTDHCAELNTGMFAMYSELKEVAVDEGNPYKEAIDQVNQFVRGFKDSLTKEFSVENWRANKERFFAAGENKESAFAKLQAAIHETLMKSDGEAVKNKAFEEAAALLTRLSMAKNFFELADGNLKIEKDIYDFSLLWENLNTFSGKVNKEVREVRRRGYKDLDYAKIEELIEDEKKKLSNAQHQMKQLQEDINDILDINSERGFSEDQKRIREAVRLYEATKTSLPELEEKQKNLMNKISEVDVFRKALDEQLEDIDSFRKVSEELKDISNLFDKKIDAKREEIENIARKIGRLEQYENNQLLRFGVNEETMNNAVNLRQEIVFLKMTCEDLQNSKVREYFESFVKNCPAFPNNADLKGILDIYQTELAVSKNPEEVEALKTARELVDAMVVKKGGIPAAEEAKAYFENLYQETIENYKTLQEKQLDDANKVYPKDVGAYMEAVNEIYENWLESEEMKEKVEKLQNEIKVVETEKNEVVSNKAGLLEQQHQLCQEKLKGTIEQIKTYMKGGDNKEDQLITELQKSDSEIELKYAKQNLEYINEFGAFLIKAPDLIDKIKKVTDQIEEDIRKNKLSSLEEEIKQTTRNKEDAEKIVKSWKRDMAATIKHCEKVVSESTDRIKTLEDISEREQALFKDYDALLDDMETGHEHAWDIRDNSIDYRISESILGNMFRIYQTLNDCRRTTTNTDYYKNMIQPLCSCLGLDIPKKGDDLRKVARSFRYTKPGTFTDKLPEIKKAAQIYIERYKDTGIFNSKQRYQRLSVAKQLIDLCNDAEKQLKYAKQYQEKRINTNLEYQMSVYEVLNANGLGKINASDNQLPEINVKRHKSFGNLMKEVANRQNAVENGKRDPKAAKPEQKSEAVEEKVNKSTVIIK